MFQIITHIVYVGRRGLCVWDKYSMEPIQSFGVEFDHCHCNSNLAVGSPRCYSNFVVESTRTPETKVPPFSIIALALRC